MARGQNHASGENLLFGPRGLSTKSLKAAAAAELEQQRADKIEADYAALVAAKLLEVDELRAKYPHLTINYVEEQEEKDNYIAFTSSLALGKGYHRDDGPAIIFDSGREDWYQGGELHREGAPAVVYKDGSMESWYRHGQNHRDGGPAMVSVVEEDGMPPYRAEWWYQNGLLHRECGPAIAAYRDGVLEGPLHYIDNVFHTEEAFELEMQKRNAPKKRRFRKNAR